MPVVLKDELDLVLERTIQVDKNGETDSLSENC